MLTADLTACASFLGFLFAYLVHCCLKLEFLFEIAKEGCHFLRKDFSCFAICTNERHHIVCVLSGRSHHPEHFLEFDGFDSNPTISPEPAAARRPLQIEDLQLVVKYRRNDEVPVDVTCNSEFMEEHMGAIGAAIRQKFHFVPADKEICLIMDNAGGHGTNDAIDRYVNELQTDYNVRVIHQEPRGPELNLLDLGAWMSLQSAVKKHFRGTRNDANALARKVEETWELYDSSVFRRVFERWKRVLDIIIVDGGNNRLVDSHRGSLFSVIEEAMAAAAAAAADDNPSDDEEEEKEDSDDSDEEGEDADNNSSSSSSSEDESA